MKLTKIDIGRRELFMGTTCCHDVCKRVKEFKRKSKEKYYESSSIDQGMKMLVQERRKLVQDYCKRYRRNDTVIGKDLRYHLVFHSKKVIYCFVPKVASSQWKKELCLLNEDNQTCSKGLHEADFKRLNHYHPEEALNMLNNYFTFMFTREPFERLLSAYKNKFLKENKIFRRAIGRNIIKLTRPNATKYALETGSGVTFPEFTKYVVKTQHLDEHWSPIDQLCHPCAINYDFIGHYESLSQDASYLVKLAGIDDRVSFPPVHPSNTTAELLQYYSHIPKGRISELAQIYQSDIGMFGYSFPGKLGSFYN
ncbi:carbohydrate sulfotransferase 11-like isoform X2 [Montipora foliosa]|uniref:carbohydrate sulfotransferase 11-like isoform X2 n=1 Tax=Montipora foliosa TaxID=591990 RepID=UPI0035F18184